MDHFELIVDDELWRNEIEARKAQTQGKVRHAGDNKADIENNCDNSTKLAVPDDEKDTEISSWWSVISNMLLWGDDQSDITVSFLPTAHTPSPHTTMYPNSQSNRNGITTTKATEMSPDGMVAVPAMVCNDKNSADFVGIEHGNRCGADTCQSGVIAKRYRRRLALTGMASTERESSRSLSAADKSRHSNSTDDISAEDSDNEFGFGSTALSCSAHCNRVQRGTARDHKELRNVIQRKILLL